MSIFYSFYERGKTFFENETLICGWKMISLFKITLKFL